MALRIDQKLWVVISMTIYLGGCADLTLPPENEQEKINSDRQELTPAFSVKDGSLFISDKIDWPLTNLESVPFIEMFLWVKDSGLFLVNLNAVFPTSEAGKIIGNELYFTCGGLDVSIVDNTGPLLSDGSTRGVAATFFPDYEIFGDSTSIDTKNISVVIGFIKENRNEIPGWKENDFEFESCPHPDR